MPAHYGKFRGLVVTADDPELIGRILVACPAVLGDGQTWAMPCVPYGIYSRDRRPDPPPGTPVWVEFEGGDPDRPVVTGYFWVTPPE